MTEVTVRSEVLSATARARGTEVVVTATRRVDQVDVVVGDRWTVECVLPGRAPHSATVTFADEAAAIQGIDRLAHRVMEHWLRLVEADQQLTAVLRDLAAGADS